MRRVWLVSWYGEWAGGLERIVRILKETLQDEYDVVVVDIPYICKYRWWKMIMNTNSRVSLMLVFSLFLKIKVRKQDILITHGQNAPFVKSDYLFDHGSIMSLKRATGEFVYGGSSVFEMIAVKKAKLNIAVSQWTKQQILSNYHISVNRVKVINNCVEDYLFYPENSDKNDSVTILFCGRLEKAKGLDDLLTLADAIEESDKYKIKIAANDKKNTEYFAGRQNVEVHCGLKTEQMNAFYNEGDVLYVPSRCEGFGMGIIESLSAGIPVVANCVGIVPELIDRKCPGIEKIETIDTVDRLLEKLETMASKYRSMDNRWELHKLIADEFGIENYKNKVRKMIKENEKAK